jgi:hypothetical protein
MLQAITLHSQVIHNLIIMAFVDLTVKRILHTTTSSLADLRHHLPIFLPTSYLFFLISSFRLRAGHHRVRQLRWRPPRDAPGPYPPRQDQRQHPRLPLMSSILLSASPPWVDYFPAGRINDASAPTRLVYAAGCDLTQHSGCALAGRVLC